MHQFVPHFSGNFSSPFLERFLVFNESMSDLDGKPYTEELSSICNTLEKSREKIKSSLDEEKNIYSKNILKNALQIEGEDYEKYKEASNEIEEYTSSKRERVLEIHTELSSLYGDLKTELEAENLSSSIKKQIIEEFLSQANSLKEEWISIGSEVESEAEEIWRKYFPENSGIPSRKNSIRLIHQEKKRQDQAQESEIITMYLEGQYPPQDSESSVYVHLRSQMILDKYQEMDHLHSGEPFSEIIKFVQSGGATPLSLEGRKILRQMESSSVKERFNNGIKGDVRRVQRLKKKTSGRSKENDAEFEKRLNIAQANILIDTNTYQLAMIDIADQARKIITDDTDLVAIHNKNRAEELGISVEELKKTEELEASIHSLSSEEQKFLKSIVPQGYIVKNSITDNYKGGATQVLGVDKVNLENFFLYEVVGTWGVLTAIANIMVSLKNGNWEESIPYILGGAAAMYVSADMVFNHSLDKVREPEKMAQWIFQEKDNQDYVEFFGDDNEIALWDNIQWPVEKSGIRGLKNDVKGIKKTKDLYQEENFSKTQKEEVHFIEKTQNINISETLTPDDFREGGNLGSYLPDFIEINGKLVPKSVLLNRLKNSPHRNKIRYKMFKKTLSRIGDKDSYLPYLHTLNGYAKEQIQKESEIKDIRNTVIQEKIPLYKKVQKMCKDRNIATTPADKLSH